MIGIVIFNVVMLLLCAMVGSRIVPASLLTSILDWLHNTIGITAPPPQKVRTVTLIWMGSTIVIVDGTLFMLVFFTARLMQR
jgi:hypothetical protein